MLCISFYDINGNLLAEIGTCIYRFPMQILLCSNKSFGCHILKVTLLMALGNYLLLKGTACLGITVVLIDGFFCCLQVNYYQVVMKPMP